MQPDAGRMADLRVELVELAPMRVASVRAVSRTPERVRPGSAEGSRDPRVLWGQTISRAGKLLRLPCGHDRSSAIELLAVQRDQAVTQLKRQGNVDGVAAPDAMICGNESCSVPQ